MIFHFSFSSKILAPKSSNIFLEVKSFRDLICLKHFCLNQKLKHLTWYRNIFCCNKNLRTMCCDGFFVWQGSWKCRISYENVFLPFIRHRHLEWWFFVGNGWIKYFHHFSLSDFVISTFLLKFFFVCHSNEVAVCFNLLLLSAYIILKMFFVWIFQSSKIIE